MQKVVKIITLVIITFVLGVFFLSLNKSTSYDTEYLVGNKLSEIKLKDFYNEEIYTNQVFKENNYTLINFWASWCGPCKIEHPVLMQLSNKKNLNIFGVNFKDKNKNALKFLADLGNPYDYIAKDELGKQSVYFGIYGIPESILLNSELIILKKFVGPLSREDLREIKKITNL